MNKLRELQRELNIIVDDDIREFTRKAIEIMPDYFFSMPASTSGKYHPKYALGKGGLLRHTKAAIKISVALFTIHSWSQLEQDVIVSSIILHDGWKCGDGENLHTTREHPIYAAKILKNNFSDSLDYYRLYPILQNISSHMGQWTNDGLLPEPQTEMEKFVHLCDYLASRKFLEVIL